MKRVSGVGAAILFLFSMCVAAAKEPAREAGSPADSRLSQVITLNSTFPFTPPTSKAAWEKRRQELREQVLVANGLWPMPERPALKATIHGRIDRGEYTVERVFFASYPGHYVCGNLYRPVGKSGKLPAVLYAHGHWSNARFMERDEKTARAEIAIGAEKFFENSRYFHQAICAQLARLGCIVFFYDMVGHSDSQQIGHTTGFRDVQAELRLQNFMGLQTFNSIRALDFVSGLPDVDPARIGMTGASGGGTQTFILCAVDDRPAAAFPAVMVSTAMQGGCICENCSYLRVGTGNIELAGIFAPKPLAMSGAHDWTIDIETKGSPELKALYKLYGAEDRVLARCFPQFDHNYNQVSREVMYNWFNKHLKLGQPEPVTERAFSPIPPAELSVFDAQHLLPKDAAGVAGLRRTMTALSNRQMAGLAPDNADRLKEFQRIVGTALRVMMNDTLPRAGEVEAKNAAIEEKDNIRRQNLVLSRRNRAEAIPALLIAPQKANGKVVVWVHPRGIASLQRDGKLLPECQKILDKRESILAVDVFLAGQSAGAPPPDVNVNFAGYTWGYNRTVLANRVHDILTAVVYARGLKDTKAVDLVGFEGAGPWVVLARALCGNAVARTAADLNQFDFNKVQSLRDEMMLPGAVKYGGLRAFAALCAPGELYLHNHSGGFEPYLTDAYHAAHAQGSFQHRDDRADAATVVNWLLR